VWQKYFRENLLVKCRRVLVTIWYWAFHKLSQNFPCGLLKKSDTWFLGQV
jgi:hypothetical protein